MRVNDEDIPIYQLDTTNSILNRIAARLGTLPKYLFFESGQPSRWTDQNLTVVDVLKIVRRDARKNAEIEKLLQKVQPYVDKMPDLSLSEDIVKVWLSYNDGLEKMASYNTMVLDGLSDQYVERNIFDTAEQLKEFWSRERDNLAKKIDQAIQDGRERDERGAELFKKFEDISEPLVYTDFIPLRVMLNFIVPVTDITPLELFNHLELKQYNPMAMCQNYYKILSDFTPFEEWLKPTEDEKNPLIIKTNIRLNPDYTKIKDYTDVALTVNNENVSGTVKLNTERNYITRKDFFRRLKAGFTAVKKFDVEQVTEQEVSGVFYFPEQRLNPYIFADLVMNDKIFSALINIDESNKATKKKSDNTPPWLYIHFNHANTGHITATISERIVDRSDPAMREQPADVFVHGQPYIRVKVTGRDAQAIKIFQDFLGKLLIIYDQEYNDIVTEYEKYIDDFGAVEEKAVPIRKEKLGSIAPEVFVKNYSRKCNDERMPTIITKEQADEYVKKGQEVMKFPRDVPKDGPGYPSDGVNQQYYVCLNPNYAYPGLQENKLSNAEKYPYLPCCFNTSQMDKKGGNYRHYYFGEKVETKEKKQQELIITDKILSPNKFGVLPDELEKVFHLLDPNPAYRYIRYGAHRNTSSFLDSVMMALDETTKISALSDPDERLARLLQIRSELAQPDVAPLSKQCWYDVNIDQLENMLANPDIYLDPKQTVQLLEGFFDCNIFLFSRDRLILPHFSQALYYNFHRSNCIFIYEHWGSESDHARFPQCELVVRWNISDSNDVQQIFPYEQKITRGVRQIFDLTVKSFALNQPIMPTVFPLPEKIKLVGQDIDSYGKTRRIDVKIGSDKVSIFTDPIPPLAIKLIEKDKIYPATVETANQLLGILSAADISQTVRNNQPAELSARVGNVNIYIPIREGEKELPFPVNTAVLHYNQNKTSTLTIYNRNRKLARYISEYAFWLFSAYINDKNVRVITDDIMAAFAQEKIEIDASFQYGNVVKTFSKKGGVMKGGKLVVTSEDMLKRVMYVVKLYSIRHLPSLLTYWQRKVISQYYIDITDFDHRPNEIILQGEDTVERWLQERKKVLILHDSVIPGFTPYFFRNGLIDNNIYLAQNADNLIKALTIALTWQRKGYNPGIHTDRPPKKIPTFTLYRYVNSEDISKYVVPGKREPLREIRLLGYKMAGRELFTVLLDL